MPFFIKHCPYVYWEVVLVSADSMEDTTTTSFSQEEFLGDFYSPLDRLYTEQVFGPFATKEEALSSDAAVVENHA